MADITYNQCDELIRLGQIPQAEQLIRQRIMKPLSRNDRLQYSNLSRRAGIPMVALKLLQPLVRPTDSKFITNPLDTEKASYAGSLINIGIHFEAIELLNSIKNDNLPEAWLFRAFSYFADWNYKCAIPILKKYLSLSISEYQYVIGLLNLLSAHIFCGHTRIADQLIKETSQRIIKNNSKHNIVANKLFELKIQNFIAKKDFNSAKKLILSNENPYYLKGLVSTISMTALPIHLQKWYWVIEMHLNGPTTELVINFQQLKDLAIFHQDCESLRELEFYFALLTENKNWMQNIYFGTRSKYYQQKIQNQTPWRIRHLSETINYREAKTNIGNLIVNTGYWNDMKLYKQGSTMARLLQILTSDHYKPASIGTLFNGIYSDEHFDSFHSLHRLKMTILRANQIFKDNNIPLRIKKTGYTFHLLGDVNIKTSNLVKPKNVLQGYLLQLMIHFKTSNFSSKQAQNILNLSPNRVTEIIRYGLNKNYLKKTGRYKTTQYLFSNSVSF